MQNKVPVYERPFYKIAFCSHLIITVNQLDHTLIKFTHANFTNKGHHYYFRFHSSRNFGQQYCMAICRNDFNVNDLPNTVAPKTVG